MKAFSYLRYLLTSLPLWVVMADAVYTVFVNLTRKLVVPKKMMSADSLLIAPDIAINWLQIGIGAVMAAVLCIVLGVLLNLNRHVIAHRHTNIGLFRAVSLILAVLFSLPAVWELLWIMAELPKKLPVFEPDVRYLTVALCLPYPLLLTLKRLYDNSRLSS